MVFQLIFVVKYLTYNPLTVLLYYTYNNSYNKMLMLSVVIKLTHLLNNKSYPHNSSAFSPNIYVLTRRS